MGVDNQWHKVVGVAKNVIGNRKIFSLPNGGCVTEDHIVFLNNESHVPSLSKLHLDFALTATNGKQGKYQIDSVRQSCNYILSNYRDSLYYLFKW